MDPRISLVTLGVKDLAASVAFYRDVVGFPLSKKSSGDVAFFELRGTWLALFPAAALAKDAGVPAEGSGFRGVTLSHNMRSRAAVDMLFRDLEKKGATVVKPPSKAEWGGHTGYFADPDGHLWEVAYNPHFWVGPK